MGGWTNDNSDALSEEQIKKAVTEHFKDHPIAAADINAVSFIKQSLTDAQQKQARENIGAASKTDLNTLAGIVASNHLDSWETISNLVKSGLAPAIFDIGEQLITPWKGGDTTYQVPQNVCHISDSEIFSDDNGETTTTGNGMYLQWHYATPLDMPFDTQKALYAAPGGGLPAGTYYFTVTGLISSWASYANNNGKTFMFTLTDDLTEGQQLMLSAKYNTVDWEGTYVRVYDSPYNTAVNTAYGTDGNIPLSVWDNESGKPLSGDVSANSTDGKGELNHIQRALLGYNRWSQSAIRKWLNSSAPARKADDFENYPGWWTSEDKYDRIPSEAFTRSGFLAGYEDDFIAAMKPVKVVTACNTATDGGVTDITYDKVFLPSLTNMNIAPQVTEGEIWDYYKQLFAANPVEGRTNWAQYNTYEILQSYGINAKTTAVHARLRSADRGGASYAWNMNSSGYVGNNTANSAFAARPACVIG